MNILVTGATGFVGRQLINQLTRQGHHCIAAVRKADNALPVNVDQVVINDLAVMDDWSSTVNRVDTVIHLAARVHMMQDTAADPLAEFCKINTHATLALARQAAAAGVKRFIFLSTIKVNGEATVEGRAFTEEDNCQPTDPYGISKQQAEQGLITIATETGMDVVIIRPPLVYGPGVKGNFASLMHWVKKGVPLPLGAIHNQRSLVALDNLVDFIGHCLTHPKAANQIFLISDGEDISTTELIQKIAAAYGRKARLLAIPETWMVWAASLLGKKASAERLFGSLQIDNSKAKQLLDWQPVISMEQQLKKID